MRNNEKYTQNLINVYDIDNGIIETRSGKLIKILEVNPINLPMKSIEDQERLFASYNAWIRTAPSKFTIKCVSKRVPIDEYSDNFRNALQNEKSSKVIRLADNHINFCTFANFEEDMTKTYFITEYSASDDRFRSESLEDKKKSLNLSSENIIHELEALGNTIEKHENEDDFLFEFLFNYYNRKAVPENKMRRLTQDEMLVNNLENLDDAVLFVEDYLAPISINDKESKEYILINGEYFSYYCIDANGYPDEISSPNGLINALVNLGSGFEVDFHFEKKDSEESLRKLRYQRKFQRMKLRDRETTAEDFSEVSSSMQAMDEIAELLRSGAEELYDMNILISINASTRKELFAKKESLESYARRAGITLNNFYAKQKEGYLSMAPLNEITQKAKKISSHNVTSQAVTALYPFFSFALHDKGGILLGKHQENHSLAIFNPFDSSKYSNANMAVFAEPGRGKTFTLLSIATRLRYLGIQVFFFAPDKQDELRRVCKAVDGEFVDISASAKTRINPFDIFPCESDADKKINGKKGNENSWLIDKIESLSKWTELLIPNLSVSDKAKIKLSLSNIYTQKGIKADNKSLFENGKKKEMPIFSDLVHELEKQDVNEDIITIFKQFTDENAPYKSLNGQTNIDIDNKFIVVGLEHLGSDLKEAMMFNLLKFVWSITKSDKTKKKAIIIDEGSCLVNGKDPQVGAFVEEIFRMIRGFGGSAIFATQSITDLFKNGSEVGNVILSCSHSKILLGMENADLIKIKESLALTASEAAQINEFRHPGEALLLAGKTHVPIKILASEEEKRLFTTSRDDLEKLAAD